MKLLRLKITDPKGFRSLQAGFEYRFRSEWNLQEEQGFAPFVCAGPNGSGKSNLLEVLAAIFFQLEVQRIRRSFLPEQLQDLSERLTPTAFELEYRIRVPQEYLKKGGPKWAEVIAWKKPGESVRLQWQNQSEFEINSTEIFEWGFQDFLLPQYVVGYSSGENEILSLPFFKMRFVQFDEYWQSLQQQLPYFGRPESRLTYLDNGFSQAILLCNMLFQDNESIMPFREDVGIIELKEFRIIIHKSISVSAAVAKDFSPDNVALMKDIETGSNTVNIVKLLEVDENVLEAAKHDERHALVDLAKISPIINRLKRCATCTYIDDTTDTLYLDYYVNDSTKKAFIDNFRDLDASGDPALALFHALQVLLTLNLYSVSDSLKADLYQSNSLYVSETIPTLASDERIMRFKFVKFRKTDVADPVMLKNLSDGEHQLLHTLGLCLLFKNTNSLFLLDEPETHFNPDWRSNFASRVNECFKSPKEEAANSPTTGNIFDREMLITTHTPFLISDSKPEKVLVFNKADGMVSVGHPDYNTLGASINKITMATFGKRETIGLRAQTMLEDLRRRFEQGENKDQIIAEINRQLGDSVEKVLLIKTILDSPEEQS